MQDQVMGIEMVSCRGSMAWLSGKNRMKAARGSMSKNQAKTPARIRAGAF
jgi:hypothetical protein